MSKQTYTKKQVQELINNNLVKSCTEKYITFTDEFKIKSLELNKKGLSPKEIFKECGFPNYIINSIIPNESLKRWRYNKKHKGINGLIGTIKGRKKKEIYDISKMTKDEELEYLRTKVAVLEEFKNMFDGDYP